MGLISDSLFIIFGVVPELISEWKPEIAPQAIVRHTYGHTGPGMTGPLPCTNWVVAGITSLGCTMATPIARIATVPSFI
jgi:hypothetical protein